MMASEWQVGKTALGHVFNPSSNVRIGPSDALLEDEAPRSSEDPSSQDGQNRGPITDAQELLEDHQGLVNLASKREEVFEASTGPDTMMAARRSAAPTGPDGTPMTRAERIAHQKKMREEEEMKRERIYDNTKMVHELKDVLGRRRHLREHDDDQEEEESQDHQQRGGVTTMSSASSLPYSTDPTFSASTASAVFSGKEPLSLDRELSLSLSQVPTEYISPFTLSIPLFSRDTDDSNEAAVEESCIEISGMGEAEYEDATEQGELDDQDNLQQEDGKSEI